jgi:L-2-hydroxyglutarate oxidase LhgO
MGRVGCVVVGAGVIGLAIARALARVGLEVIILEGEAQFGSWTSARNSEVIHAGLYYPQGTLKARLCVAGRELLYAYCEARQVPHRRCGKLIVATQVAQIDHLASIETAARDNGVTSLHHLTSKEVKALEPDIICAEALLSPQTGIIDSHSYMLALLAEAESLGAQLVCNTKVERLARHRDDWAVNCEGLKEPLFARCVVNAAGLAAQTLAHETEGLDSAHVPGLHLAKGVYFTYSGRTTFQRLIYPVPEPGGLGIHLTLDLAGQARFGPDVEWVDKIDYSVDPARKDKFLAAVRQFWPGVDPDFLTLGYAGVRPKISSKGEPAADFCISGPADHGLPRLVNLFGIESPGLTASLAIAEEVVKKLDF